MFERLVASAPQRRRSAGQAVTSAAVHLGIVVLAVQTTAGRADPGPALPRVDTTIWSIADPAPAPTPGTSSPGPGRPHPEAPTDLPPTPPLPLAAEITAGVPPLDAPQLGDAARVDGAAIARRFGSDAGTAGSPSGSLGDSSRAFTAGQLDRIVELLDQPAPIYPPVLKSAGVTGYADVEFVVGRDGRVEPTTLRVTAATHDAFAASARAAVLGARFRPALLRGSAVRQLVRQRVRFESLSRALPPPPRAHARAAAGRE